MLSIKTAQFDAIYEKVKQDSWVQQNLGILPTEALISYLAETYQLAEGQAEEVAKMLTRSRPVPTVTLALAKEVDAQVKNIIIPPTTDNPVSRTVAIPEEEKEAPDETKVPLSSKQPEEAKQVLETSVEDQQKTRQEQLQNSFRAMEVVLADFSKAMYGLELTHDSMGKVMESIIDKVSDVAAEQTADTVKQLASPYIAK